MRQTCTQQPQIALPAYGAIHSAINSPAPMPPREASFCEPMAPISPSSRKTEEASIDFSFLSKYSIALKIDRGDVFIREDAPAKHFYLIGKGAAMSFKTLPGGRRQVTHFTGGGDLVGLSNLDTFGYTAKSLSDVWLYRFPRSILSSFCSKLPGFTNLLFRNARYELMLAHEQLLLLGSKTARERIASFLLSHVQTKHCRDQIAPLHAHVSLPMRRIDIADFLGLRCETVSRILTQMKQENVIATLPAGVIIIRNSEILKMYAAGIYTASTCKEISRKEG